MQTAIITPSEHKHLNNELQTRALELKAISNIFNFFSRCIEQEIDKDFIKLIRGELKEVLQNFGIVFNEEIYTGSIENLVEQLAEEYTGLFVAPGCISPYASVFETGCMFKEPVDKAIAAYHEAGWDYKTLYSGEFPDHIGTMIGFYGLLCSIEYNHILNSDLLEADKYLELRKRFIIDQLGNWAPGWCHLASQVANENFYQNVLQLLEQLLWSELSLFVDRRQLRELAELNKREPKRMDYDADFRKASGL